MSKELLRQEFNPDQAGSLVGWHQLGRDPTSLTLDAAYAYVGCQGAEYTVTETDGSLVHSVHGFRSAKSLRLTFELADEMAELQSAGFGGTNFWSEDGKTLQIPESYNGADSVEWFTDHTRLMPGIREEVQELGLSNPDNIYASMYYHLNALKLHLALDRGFRTLGTFGTVELADRAFTDPDMSSTTETQIGIAEEVIAQAEGTRTLYEKFSVVAVGEPEPPRSAPELIDELIEEVATSEAEAFRIAGQLVVPDMVYAGHKDILRDKREPRVRILSDLDDGKSKLKTLSARSASAHAVHAALDGQAQTLGARISFAGYGLNSLIALHQLEEVA